MTLTLPAEFDEQAWAAAFNATTDPDELDALIAAAESYRVQFRKWAPQDYQLPPSGAWWTWVFSAGAGAGKTDTGAWWFDEHMKGPPCDPRVPGGHKGLVGGPTFGDAVATCWNYPAGLRAHNPDVRLVTTKGNTLAVWPNGAEATFVGLHTDHDAQLLRARAANCCCWWLDEAALARHLRTALDHIQARARMGVAPRGIITSTPKPTEGWKYLIRLPEVVETHGSAYQNRYLSATHKRRLDRFKGTRYEQQEIHGVLVDDFLGALTTRDAIASQRITTIDGRDVERMEPEEIIDLLGINRVYVGVDPSTWIPEIDSDLDPDEYVAGTGIETGIVVNGLADGPPRCRVGPWVPTDDQGEGPHVYTLADYSGRLEAVEWSKKAVDALHRWNAAGIVPETNAGGDMVLATIRLTDPYAPIYREPGSKRYGVRARQGKRARAEPVGLLFDQGRKHHVGVHVGLENTWCGWDPSEDWSPDRLDADVWSIFPLAPWRDYAEPESSMDVLRGATLNLR